MLISVVAAAAALAAPKDVDDKWQAPALLSPAATALEQVRAAPRPGDRADRCRLTPALSQSSKVGLGRATAIVARYGAVQARARAARCPRIHPHSPYLPSAAFPPPTARWPSSA